MKSKMSKQEARKLLYSMWKNGDIESNFTEEHSEHSSAIQHLMIWGHIKWELL